MPAKKENLLGLIPDERILKYDIPRPSEEIVQSFLALRDMAGLVARVMDRMGIVGDIPAYELTPLNPGHRIVGPALTVRNVPSRFTPLYGSKEGMDTQLGEREVYFIAKPGDVMVIDSGGRMICSNMGPTSSAMAKSQGIIAAIVDGPVTGVAGIRDVDLPLWCRGGTTTTGHYRIDTIEINGIISCVRVQVIPGDLVVADDSGVTIVPQTMIEEVLEESQKWSARSTNLAKMIADGAKPNEMGQALQELVIGKKRS